MQQDVSPCKATQSSKETLAIWMKPRDLWSYCSQGCLPGVIVWVFAVDKWRSKQCNGLSLVSARYWWSFRKYCSACVHSVVGNRASHSVRKRSIWVWYMYLHKIIPETCVSTTDTIRHYPWFIFMTTASLVSEMTVTMVFLLFREAFWFEALFNCWHVWHFAEMSAHPGFVWH